MSSVSQRIRILKYTAEQGVVSVDDVFEHLKDFHSSSSVRVYMHKMGLGRMKYGTVRHGVWYINDHRHLENLKSHFPDMPPVGLNSAPAFQIPHCLGLNRIRNLFDKSTKIKPAKWLSEGCLRAMNPSERDGFNASNIPDAIFWRVKNDGTQQKYFVEFERTLKNPARYKDIFMNYARRSDTGEKNVLYICKNDSIRDSLKRTEKKLVDSGYLDAIDKYFQFITLEGLYLTCGYNHPNEEEDQCIN